MSIKWESDAVESLQSLERYIIVKAINESKNLVKKVTDLAIEKSNGTITKSNIKDAIAFVLNQEIP